MFEVHELEPQLHPAVVGGWWFPEDASVDARRLTCSLRAACVAAGVHFQSGPNFGVSSLDLQGTRLMLENIGLFPVTTLFFPTLLICACSYIF